MTDLVLWGATTSRTIRAHWALRELGLAYRCMPIRPRSGETKTERFTAVNPRQKIPVLVDDGFTITESAAIISYLSGTYPPAATALVPTEPRERARYDEWAFFILAELDATSLYVVRRHLGLPGIYGEAPIAVEAALAYFQRQAGSVAMALDDGREWLMGSRFTGADILLTTCLTWATRLELPLAESLTRYRDRATARPAYIAAAAANEPEYWTQAGNEP
jgi:glutathione S-transferase